MNAAARLPRNRLATELSPYLRQHAHNPVDWSPWGPEALERSKLEDKPILLSIGYSACHWCHVMERESFDNEAIAAKMNELFVSIKVDREERPDLDQIYQLVVQIMGRGGGWPLTVFLTPELKPFFGGTYFPPVDRHGMPGFPAVLEGVARAYREQRAKVLESSEEITASIGRVLSAAGDAHARTDIPADVIVRAAAGLSARFDDRHGGFGSAPKFPNTFGIDVLLRAGAVGEPRSSERARHALDAMSAGGIWDHLGGGFHRYATDARWLVPHFEKMLYDNALLVRTYLDAWRCTGHEPYAQVVRDSGAYIEREMLSPEGGFYSSQDADSEGEEGVFFVWTPEQLREVLSEQEAEMASLYFGVDGTGNFENGTTVLHESCPIAAAARQLGVPEPEAVALLHRSRTKLFAAREQRPKPFRDEKLIASWNGLMIGALAEAGGALGDERVLAMALNGLKFLKAHLFRGGLLMRLYKDGVAAGDAFLEDYGDAAGAAIDVYENTMELWALDFAQVLASAAIDQFWDPEAGAFFFSPPSRTDLIVRGKDPYDNATPSGTSSLCHALLRLCEHTGDGRFADRAEQTLRMYCDQALDNPFAFGHLLCAMDRQVRGATTIVVVGESGDPLAKEMLALVRRSYLPNRVLLQVPPSAPETPGAVSLLAGKRAINGRATAYVCRGRTCSAPVTTVDDLRMALPLPRTA